MPPAPWVNPWNILNLCWPPKLPRDQYWAQSELLRSAVISSPFVVLKPQLQHYFINPWSTSSRLLESVLLDYQSSLAPSKYSSLCKPVWCYSQPIEEWKQIEIVRLNSVTTPWKKPGTKMVTRKDCSSLREHLGVKTVMFGVYKDWVCKKNVMGWSPCFRIVSASQCTLEWAPHTYPTSENSSTLPRSACWKLRSHYRFACFVLKSLLWYFSCYQRRSISVAPIVTGLQCLHY